MNMSRSRKVAAGLVAIALIGAMLVPLFVKPKTAGAAGNGPTAGSYTYVVEGRETGFPFDPIQRQNGLLVPVEVFTNEGFTVTVNGSTVNVSRNKQTATLTLGSSNVNLFGNPTAINPVPMRVSDHLFLPAALASYYGVDITLDGIYVFVHDNTAGQAATTSLSSGDYGTLLNGRTIPGVTVRADNNQPLTATLTVLNSAVVADTNFTTDPNLRARLQTLLPNYTLVLVDVKNNGSRSGLLVPTNLYLTDANGNEYTYTGTALPVNNQNVTTTRLVPGAEMQTVLAFNKVPSSLNLLNVWADSNNATLGSFTTVQ